MATPDDIIRFRATFPEFATVSDPAIATVLNTADLFLDESVWAPRDWPMARYYWAAHMLQLQQMQAASAEIGGAGMADLFLRNVRYEGKMVSFGERQSFAKEASSGPGEELLTLTIYGLMYLQLRTRNIMPVLVI
jgi:Protein of unknown function (DUF4054)